MEQPAGNNSKKVWIIVGSIAGLCLLGVVVLIIGFGMIGRLVSKTVGVDPAAAAKTAHEITDYDLPSGYIENMSMNILTTHMVMIGPEGINPGLMITLAEFGTVANSSPEEMEKQFERSFQQQTNQPFTNMQQVEKRPLTVRGSQTEAVISEGSSVDGNTVRQLVVVFPGKKGVAMLMISGDREQWDEDLIYTFIASFR